MVPVLLALLSTAAWAWPEDTWVPLVAEGQPVGDWSFDALQDPEGPLEIAGHSSRPALAWWADDEAVWLRVRLAAAPVGVEAPLPPGAWGVAFDTTGDDALNLLIAVEGPSGMVRAHALDGPPGIWPGADALTLLGDVGGWGEAARQISDDAGDYLELRVGRPALESWGIGDTTPFRIAAVTTSALGQPWVDVSRCLGLCDEVDEALSDPVAIDADLDTLTEPYERLLGTDPYDADTDNDGLLDGEEPPVDFDGDGLIAPLDCDSDGDGILDGTEAGLTLADLHPDTQLSAFCFWGDADPSTTTNPWDPDTDGGGLPDGIEDFNRNGRYDPPWETNPLDRSDDLDTDGDGIADVLERRGGDGSVDDEDSDGDGIPDSVELLYDTDGDGIPDFLDLDSDGDGIPDAVEGYEDTDGDGILDFRDLDCDNDGIPDPIDGLEDADGDGRPNYKDPDSDGDGIPDAIEGLVDTDRDGIPDYLDLDSDGDGIPDAIEGFGDTDGDGIPDFRDLDSDGDTIPDRIETADDVDGDGVPNFRDLDSDGDGIPDVIELLNDVDCDGIPDFIDPDHEDSFCDDPQAPPRVDDSPWTPSPGKPADATGSLTGGPCSTAPSPAGLLPLLLAGLAVRRRRVAAAALLTTSPALAQDIDGQRFAPSVAGGAFVKVEDARAAEAGTASVGAWMDYASRPFVYRMEAEAHSREVPILASVATTHLTGALHLGRLTVGAHLPMHVHADTFHQDGWTFLGDARLAARGVVLQATPQGWLDRVDLAVLSELTLPTGAPRAFLGAGSPRVRGAAIGTLTSGRLLLSGHVGVRSGTGASIGPLVVGPAVVWGVGAGMSVTETLSATLEMDRDHWLGNAGLAMAPSEWLGAVHLQTALGRLTLGGGSGLSPGIGAPDLRVVMGLATGMGR